jgi:Fe-S cluster biogenesis protein NfuA
MVPTHHSSDRQEDAMREALETVLEKFRPGYQADGSDIFLGSVDAGTVEVRIAIRPETCVECLLPEDLVATILTREFSAVAPEVTGVNIRLFKDESHTGGSHA